jgi:hypothetical protein
MDTTIKDYNFEADDSVLLECDATTLGNQFPTSNAFIFKGLWGQEEL